MATQLDPRQPDEASATTHHPPFPRERVGENPVGYRVRVRSALIAWVAAAVDRYPFLQPRASDAESDRSARRLHATVVLTEIAKVELGRSLTMTEQAAVFDVARDEYARREKWVVDDLADRMADNALRAPTGLEMALAQMAQYAREGRVTVTGYESLAESGYMVGPIAKVAQ